MDFARIPYFSRNEKTKPVGELVRLALTSRSRPMWLDYFTQSLLRQHSGRDSRIDCPLSFDPRPWVTENSSPVQAAGPR